MTNHNLINTIEKTDEICVLCAQELPRHPIVELENSFCCFGCQAVFNILAAKNQLENFEQHPIFQQALRSGLVSNPALIEQIQQKRPIVHEGEIEKLHLEVQEMWCPSCADVIRLFLLQQKGVMKAVVDYASDLAAIEYSPRHISKEQIYSLVDSLGYRAGSLQDSAKKIVSFDLYLRFIIAAFCSVNVMMLAYPLYATYFDEDPEGYGLYFARLSFVMSLPVLFYSAWPIFRRFFNSLRWGLVGMETLVFIGVIASFGLSLFNILQGSSKVYFDSMTAIIVFVLLGKIIEAKAKYSAKDSMMRLSRSIPKKGRKKFPEGTLKQVLLKDIRKGDTLLVLTGEKIVLDGIVLEGEGACDESLMTGEVYPVSKKVGSHVLGGSLVQQGSFTFKATVDPDESTLQKIVQMVEQDIGQKSAYFRSADQIVKWFVPLVIVIACMAGGICFRFGITDPGQTVFETAFVRAISILLISCPCAIGIAAPLAESQLMNGLARLGAIVRNRGCLTLLGRETVFIFDKTGTITEGRFKVMEGIEKLGEEEKSILKGLTTQSNHPICCAINQALFNFPAQLARTKEFSGKGMEGEYQNDLFFLGSLQFLQDKGILASIPDLRDDGIVSVVYFAKNQTVLSSISLGDELKPGAEQLIKSLGKKRTILLSGDSEKSVVEVAKRCGFSEYLWGMTPLQKRDYVDSLRQNGDIVCMLGDGINDAPALTSSQVSISVVSAADISIQVSDILLTTDGLSVIEHIEKLAIFGRRIIKQNLFWAFFYNVVGIALAVFGILSPIFSAFAMMASSLIVLFNAKRLS